MRLSGFGVNISDKTFLIFGRSRLSGEKAQNPPFEFMDRQINQSINQSINRSIDRSIGIPQTFKKFVIFSGDL
jgi:hypothetical protein